MSSSSRFSLIKPTLQTEFHIDFEWLRQHDQNWRVHLQSCLCDEHQQAFGNLDSDKEIDWIDPETAQIHKVDALQHILMTHCAKQDDFITNYTTLVDAVFRIFLSNGNAPTNPEKLGEITGRSPQTILKTLTGVNVYKGIRPVQK